MEQKSESFRDRLLSQAAPQETKLETYRKEMQAMLDHNEKMLRREKWYAGAIWIFTVFLVTAFLVLGGQLPGTPMGVFLPLFGCVMLIMGGVELLKHFINRSRVDVLKEVKQLELRVLELQEQLKTRSA